MMGPHSPNVNFSSSSNISLRRLIYEIKITVQQVLLESITDNIDKKDDN